MISLDISWRPTLPLLTKDLIEQSMQRRTYVYRSVFVAVIYLFGLWIYWDWSTHGFAGLGRGADVLLRLTIFQTLATYAIVPLVASGALAGEKERNTLELLLVTKLTPRVIVIEKFAAQLVSTFLMQVAALPLIALTYPMGGVSLAMLFCVFVYLLCASGLTVAWAILWSSWAYTTQGALLGYLSLVPYGILVAVPAGRLQQILFPIVGLYFCLSFMIGLIVAAQFAQKLNAIRNIDAIPKPVLNQQKLLNRGYFPSIVSVLSIVVFQSMAGFGGILIRMYPEAAAALGMLLFTAFALWLVFVIAPLFLLVRSKSPSWRPPSEILTAVNAAVEEVNDLATAGIVLSSQTEAVCIERPVRWRELQRRGLRFRTLFRSVIAAETILALAVIRGTASGPASGDFKMIWLIFEISLWFAATAVLTITSINLFSLERFFQTLDVLLATPMSSRNIIEQKLIGPQRMIAAWAILLATMWFVRLLFLDAPASATGLFTAAVFPLFTVWLGMFLGLFARNRVIGTFAAATVIVTVIFLPWLLVWFNLHSFLWLCPTAPLAPEEFWTSLRSQTSPIGQAVRCALLMLILVGLRSTVYRKFSSWVGRLEAERQNGQFE